MDTNFFGPLFLARAYAAILAKQPGAAIIDLHSSERRCRGGHWQALFRNPASK